MIFVKKSLLVLSLVGSIVLGTAVSPALAASGVHAATVSSADSTLVVDGDGDAEYQSIQAAVENATEGDTVEVRPGTYREAIFIENNITLVAPNGATLNGSTLDEELVGIRVVPDSNAEPVIDGFTIIEFEKGIHAENTVGDWTARNVTVLDNHDEGIEVENSTGDWTVRNATIIDHLDGFDIDNADGDWKIIDTTIRDSEEQSIDGENMDGDWVVRGSEFSESRQGILALHSTGDWLVVNTSMYDNSRTGMRTFNSSGNWTIRNSDFYENRIVGVSAIKTSGVWTVQNTSIWNSSVGIHAKLSTEDWTIRNSSIWGIETPGFFFDAGGTGVYAVNTSGAWSVHDSNIVRTERYGVNATQANPQGDVTNNWWGQASGPSENECIGNVTCAEPLSEQHTGDKALTETTTTTTATTTTTDSTTTTTTTTESSAMADTTETTTESTSSPGVPGFGLVVAVLALLAGVFLLARRQ